MTQAADKSSKSLPVIDDAAITETFVDDVVGIALINGNCHLTFATRRADHSRNQDPAPISRQISARLVIPLSGAIETWQLIGNLLQDLEAKGVLVKHSAEPVTLQ